VPTFFEKMRPHEAKSDLAREMCGWVYFPCVLHYPAWKKCDLAREMCCRAYFLCFALSDTFCAKIVLLYFWGIYLSESSITLIIIISWRKLQKNTKNNGFDSKITFYAKSAFFPKKCDFSALTRKNRKNAKIADRTIAFL